MFIRRKSDTSFMGFKKIITGKGSLSIFLKFCSVFAVLFFMSTPQIVKGADGSLSELDILKKEVAELKESTKTLRDLVLELEKRKEENNRRLHLSRYKLPDKIEFAGEKVPVDKWDVKERLDLDFLLLLGDEPQVLLYLKRSGRYFPIIEKILREQKMPDDLKYVAVVESGLRAVASSSAGAVGPWQFMAATGKRYNLEKHSWLDERRNVEKATLAAIRYLSDLHRMFGAWSLALAGYNAGEERVSREMRAQGVNNYYQLMLPAETERFFFKIVLVKTILSDPERYGFHLPKEDYYQPFDTEVIKMDIREPQVSLRSVAEASGSYYREMRKLNPELTDDYLPTGVYELRIPRKEKAFFEPKSRRVDKVEAVIETSQANSKEAATGNSGEVTQVSTKTKKTVYEVKKGDTLSSIAERFKVNASAIKQWNNLGSEKLIHPGQKLLILKDS